MITVDVETTEQGQPSVIHLYDKNGERQAFNIITAYLCEQLKSHTEAIERLAIKLLAIDIKFVYRIII